MGQFWTKIFRHRDVRVVFLGLDAVGKTTLLYKLKLGEVISHTVPTIGFNVETIQYRDIHFTTWDIGSRDKVRPLFRHYYKGMDAVVVIIDSTDSERLDELNYDVIKPALGADELSNSVFLFLANKCDLPNTMSSQEIADRLNLKAVKHNCTIMHASAVTGEGIEEAMDWLAVQLGSVQARKTLMAPATTATDKPEDLPVKLENRLDYCTRAYSAIKCLFTRPSKQESPDV
ncbi:hypothetical protein ACJMK2_008362 [Sinanodonta woodiana]|uniref:ADP-ribosylation factor n=1 Tax=Sinanodonta woodiana TaxID=1069815 RepID=A0ABD3VPC2_SINWO